MEIEEEARTLAESMLNDLSLGLADEEETAQRIAEALRDAEKHGARRMGEHIYENAHPDTQRWMAHEIRIEDALNHDEEDNPDA